MFFGGSLLLTNQSSSAISLSFTALAAFWRFWVRPPRWWMGGCIPGYPGGSNQMWPTEKAKKKRITFQMEYISCLFNLTGFLYHMMIYDKPQETKAVTPLIQPKQPFGPALFSLLKWGFLFAFSVGDGELPSLKDNQCKIKLYLDVPGT